MYVLIENGTPIRKAHTAAKAWGSDVVTGHPVDSEGTCVFDDGRTLEVREYPLGTDVWYVAHSHDTFGSYFYGTARNMRKEYGFFDRADRLAWNGQWEIVYN